MTFCILSSSYPRHPGDAANAGVFVRDFVRALSGEGQKVQVFTHRKGRPGVYEEPFPITEYPWLGTETSLTSVDTSSIIGIAKAASLLLMGTLSYLKLCKAGKVKMSLAMWAVPSGIFGWMGWKLLKVPYCVWALGSDIWRYERSRFMGPVLRRVLADARYLYADGMELAARVEAVCGKPCGFLPSARDLSEVEPEAVDENLPSPRFLFVGRWENNKGSDLLVEAAALYFQSGGIGSVDIFGEGSLEKSMRSQVAGMEEGHRLRLHGPIGPGGMVGRLAWCDYLIIPSRIESIPVVLSDALQRGVPVIVTDVGDMGKLVGESKAGRVCPPGDPQALAAAMSEMDTADPKDFHEGVALLAGRFSVSQSARRFLDDAGRES